MKNTIGSNQYCGKPKYRTLIFTLVLIIAGIGVYQYYNARETRKTAPGQEFVSKKDICAGNANCQAKIENLAAQTLLGEEMRKEKAAYEAKMLDYENRMGALREQELSLQ